MECPIHMIQASSGRKNAKTNMRLFRPSLGNFSFNLAFVVSLRTSMPEWKVSLARKGFRK